MQDKPEAVTAGWWPFLFSAKLHSPTLPRIYYFKEYLPMKVSPILLALVLGLSVASFGQTVEAQNADAKSAAKPEGKAAAPKLALAKTQHDFGELKKGVLAQYDFKFKNEGTAELTINNVAPS
jgi:hypothetical protein